MVKVVVVAVDEPCWEGPRGILSVGVVKYMIVDEVTDEGTPIVVVPAGWVSEVGVTGRDIDVEVSTGGGTLGGISVDAVCVGVFPDGEDSVTGETPDRVVAGKGVVSVSVTGQIVVDTAIVEVTTEIELVGQLVTVGSQLVIVISWVVHMVDVVKLVMADLDIGIMLDEARAVVVKVGLDSDTADVPDEVAVVNVECDGETGEMAGGIIV